ncbi:MAG: hypothetical protein A3F78_07445 [Burkholderiales bacterium RIFCSPLOWO2_12_FULL_61_40]|nr:MAG: hypothetical protein A3F78_07445 [Burkholderiales bacterium RIFCSPLOWO2_12_FULL_61_40]
MVVEVMPLTGPTPAHTGFEHDKWHERVQAAAAVAKARRNPRRFVLRWVVPTVLAVLLGMGLQSLRTADLEERLSAAHQRVGGVDAALQRLREDAPSRSDVEAMRDLLARSIDGAQARVSAMEAGSLAPVVAQVGASVGLVQGRYVLVHPTKGLPLRLKLSGGKVQRNSEGGPRLTLSGSGPVFMSTFMGTFFVIDSNGTLLTNRHVALPWEDGGAAQAMKEFGVHPVMIEMRGFLPGQAESFDVMVKGVGKQDLALLHGSGPALQAKPLVLAKSNPLPGDAALVFGYPTGLNALLARADDDFVAKLKGMPDMDDRRVADILAQVGLVQPLVSRGIVAQVTDAAVVYDAQTAGGGSGGPVVNLRGEVVAVNRAILQNFNGSNMGVPVETAAEMLRQAARIEAEQK